MVQRILITGGSGTLGQQLVPRLKSAGYSVRISSRKARSNENDGSIEWAQASLESPSGWADAVQDVDVIVHAASFPFKRGADIKGTGYMLSAANLAGVQHIVYISIVGVDKRDWFYYKEKFACEQLIKESSIPFTILRATQFHDFANMLLKEMFLRSRIGFLPNGWRIQPIDGSEVAAILSAAVRKGPAGYLPEAGGPEVLTLEEMAETWMAVFGRRRIIKIPFPFLMGKAFGNGHNLAPDSRIGKLTWRDWVHQNHT